MAIDASRLRESPVRDDLTDEELERGAAIFEETPRSPTRRLRTRCSGWKAEHGLDEIVRIAYVWHLGRA